VTTADLLVLTPWLIFGAGLGVIGFRLLSQRATTRRHRRDTRLRHRSRLYPAMRDHGGWAAEPRGRPGGRREGR
jgi:hypothetical protein